jgi:hypothetical protein
VNVPATARASATSLTTMVTRRGALFVPRHGPAGEDVAQRALARAAHAGQVQQAVNAQRLARREAAVLANEQLDAVQAVGPATLAIRGAGRLLPVYLRGRSLQLRPDDNDRFAPARWDGLQVVREQSRADGQVLREHDRVAGVADREQVLPGSTRRGCPGG